MHEVDSDDPTISEVHLSVGCKLKHTIQKTTFSAEICPITLVRNTGFNLEGLEMAAVDEIFDVTMNDGSRHFCELPQTVLWYEFREHVSKLQGAMLTGFVTDHVLEAWIDFSYKGYEFSVNDQFEKYWFFVKERDCPDLILREVMNHFHLLLLPNVDERSDAMVTQATL